MPDVVLLNYVCGVLNECIFILTLTRIDRLSIVASHMYYIKPKVSNLAFWLCEESVTLSLIVTDSVTFTCRRH